MRAWLLAAVLAVLQGCALTVSDPRALNPIDGFVPLASDTRVWIEPGHEAFGARVAAALPAAVARVERRLPAVPATAHPRGGSEACYMCDDAETVGRGCRQPADPVPKPRRARTPPPAYAADARTRAPASGQRIGQTQHPPAGPRAGPAAAGGGAEYATDVQVRGSAPAGGTPPARDPPDQRPRAARPGSTFTRYRQSMLLVGWLKAQDETRFRALALAVQDNTDFEIAFWNIYGQAPSDRLAGFFDGVLGDNQPIQAAPAQP
jgi:hypothetical protein